MLLASEPKKVLNLRPYQRGAVDTLLAALAQGQHPVCGAATGAGKSLIIAELCRRLPGRILVATHRKELLTQNDGQLTRLLGEDGDSGIYSAGLERRDLKARILFGGIQSIYRRMDVLQQAGDFGHIIIDECHLVPDRLEEASAAPRSMYQQVFDTCPEARRIGLSATPYRLDAGAIFGTPTSWFTCMPVDIGMRQLTEQGYLAPLVGVQAAKDIDLSKVRVRQGDYVTAELSQVMNDEARVRGAVSELANLAAHRAAWLCFCCDVTHTKAVTQEMQRQGILARMVVGTTPQGERDAIITDFRAGKFQCLVNCQVATTGFDIPQIDTVVLMRPTQSKSLLVQMLGRGARLAPGKESAVIFDYADTIRWHMPLEEIPQLTKTAAVEKQEADEAKQRELNEKDHARHRTSVIADAFAMEREYRVELIKPRLVPSSSQRGKYNVQLLYLCPDRTPSKWLTIWLCPEYSGWPRLQAEAWFSRRAATCPFSAAQATTLVQRLPLPSSIVVQETGKFPRITIEHFDDREDAFTLSGPF